MSQQGWTTTWIMVLHPGFTLNRVVAKGSTGEMVGLTAAVNSNTPKWPHHPTDLAWVITRFKGEREAARDPMGVHLASLHLAPLLTTEIKTRRSRPVDVEAPNTHKATQLARTTARLDPVACAPPRRDTTRPPINVICITVQVPFPLMSHSAPAFTARTTVVKAQSAVTGSWDPPRPHPTWWGAQWAWAEAQVISITNFNLIPSPPEAFLATSIMASLTGPFMVYFLLEERLTLPSQPDLSWEPPWVRARPLTVVAPQGCPRRRRWRQTMIVMDHTGQWQVKAAETLGPCHHPLLLVITSPRQYLILWKVKTLVNTQPSHPKWRINNKT